MLIKRKAYLEQIRKYYDSNLIKVITGIRRCGKSILLNQIMEEIMESDGIDKNHIISINFEDLRFSKINTDMKLNSYILKRIVDDRNTISFWMKSSMSVSSKGCWLL